MNNMPGGWTQVRFEDAVSSVSDGGFRIQQKNYLAHGKLPVVDQGEGLVGGYSDDTDAAVVTAGPVIVFGDHTRRFKFVDFPFVVGADGVKLFSPTPLWDPHFLFYQLGTIELEDRGYGRHYQQLRLTSLVLAPISEQARIVAKLEELLSELDAGIAELNAAQKKLARYRQSLLKSAVDGALTAGWRQQHLPAETGAHLLERILIERRERWEAKQLAKFKEQGKAPPKDWQKKYLEPVKPDTANLPDLPDGWVWACLGQLLTELTSGSRDWAPYYDRGSSVFVMAQNVRPWRPDFSFKQYVDPPADHRDRVRSEISIDDLLITIVGANTGQICRIAEPLTEYFVCQSVALLRPAMPEISEYVNAVLNSEGHGQLQFREMNYGAGRPHLSFDQLESVTVPIPPLVEQARIVSAVLDSLASVEKVERELVLLFGQATAQRQNILRAAFAGQLVPQDPNDEPASVLLERIRAQRDAAEQSIKPRKARTIKAKK